MGNNITCAACGADIDFTPGHYFAIESDEGKQVIMFDRLSCRDSFETQAHEFAYAVTMQRMSNGRNIFDRSKR